MMDLLVNVLSVNPRGAARANMRGVVPRRCNRSSCPGPCADRQGPLQHDCFTPFLHVARQLASVKYFAKITLAVALAHSLPLAASSTWPPRAPQGHL
jgi:hypothetical protein